MKQNVLGTVVGQSATGPGGRVTIAFARREDGRSNNLTLAQTHPAGVDGGGGWVGWNVVPFFFGGGGCNCAMVENWWEFQYLRLAIGICGGLKGENFIDFIVL